MKKVLFILTIACIIFLCPACHSRKKALALKLSHQTNHPTKPVAKAKPSAKAEAEPKRKAADPITIRKKYAQILGISPARISNYALYSFIDRWYGTRYQLGGCDANGIDCSGFVQKLYTEVYTIDLVRTAMQQYRNCKRIKKPSDAIEGDLVFFSIQSKNITHVGIYLANNFFVHASSSNGIMISNLEEEYWSKYYAGCGRVLKG